MKEDDHYPDLLSEFSPVDTQEWLEKARKDLKGEEPLQKFAWEPNPGIHIKPYYDRKDLENLPDLFPDHPLVYSEAPDPRFWENREAVRVSAVNEANALSLEALNGGVNGLIFHCNGTKEIDLDTLLSNVPLPQTFVSFSTTENGQALWNDIEQFLSAQGLENTVQGSFYTDNRDVELLERRVRIASEGFKGIGIQCSMKNLSGPEELAYLLSEAVFVLDKLTDLGHKPTAILRHLEFCLSLGVDFFVEMARVRALRILLYQLAKAYQAPSFTPMDVAIYANSQKWIEEAYQPHGNMLKSTTAALAAIAGGCNALTVEPENAEDKLDRRIARNVSNVLKAESYLGKAADPASGSYFIETLTWQLVQQSWKTFVSWEQKGGFENL